jgi:heme oxygenase
MLLTLAADSSRVSNRFILKQATEQAHDAIEATPPMRMLMGGTPTVAAVSAAIAGQGAVIATLEAQLAHAAPSIRSQFKDYRPRAPLARADLFRLGQRPGLTEAEAPRLESPAAWLGFRYVVEGSSLGGALIRRHLAEHAPDLPPLAFFDPHGPERGRLWGAFCARLEAALADEQALAEASAAAVAVFAALRENLEAAGA